MTNQPSPEPTAPNRVALVTGDGQFMCWPCVVENIEQIEPAWQSRDVNNLSYNPTDKQWDIIGAQRVSPNTICSNCGDRIGVPLRSPRPED